MLGGGGGGGSEFMLEVELVLRKHEAREERSDDVVLILGINARASREVKAAENEEWNEARKERSDDAFYCGGSKTYNFIPRYRSQKGKGSGKLPASLLATARCASGGDSKNEERSDQRPYNLTRRFAPRCRRSLPVQQQHS